MSRHHDEFTLPLALSDSLHLCNAAVRTLGWSVLEQSEQHLVCTEGAYQIGSITYPAKVEISLASDTDGFTRIAFNGSIFGIGPIQSGHLKKGMEQLRSIITQYAAPRAAVPSGQADADTRSAAPPPTAAPARSVIINAVQLNDDQITALEQQFQSHLPDGSYWYDNVSGAWGVQGGPAIAILLPGLNLGGLLRADASNGNTGVLVNGRELHYMDLLSLQQIIPVIPPGRYWIDAQGNVGLEDGPALGNLWALAQSAAANQGGGVWRTYGDGSGAYRNSNVGIGFINDGEGNFDITN